MKTQKNLDKSLALIQQYIETDQAQELLLLELLKSAAKLDEGAKQSCIEMVHKLGGPCNHYFDLTDAINGDG